MSPLVRRQVGLLGQQLAIADLPNRRGTRTDRRSRVEETERSSLELSVTVLARYLREST
jgi:hypothetical protein